MKLTKSSDHIWQLAMSEAEFQIIQKVTGRIAQDFDDLDFWTLESVEKSQLTTLSAAFSGAAYNDGHVVLEINDENYKVLRRVINFADGFMNEEFEQDGDAIIHIADILTQSL
ncbi:MAG: hypothetical protein P0119_06335 [Nitrospira sp.]|nr:hypothetical protein [Nitrospira sp.]